METTKLYWKTSQKNRKELKLVMMLMNRQSDNEYTFYYQPSIKLMAKQWCTEQRNDPEEFPGKHVETNRKKEFKTRRVLFH